jgi:hypothetical protein
VAWKLLSSATMDTQTVVLEFLASGLGLGAMTLMTLASLRARADSGPARPLRSGRGPSNRTPSAS